MSFKISGKVHAMMATKQVSERFTKREFVLEVEDGKYPQLVLFQATNDRVERIADLNVGDVVDIEFNLRGREWKSGSGELKYFNSCDVWKLELVKAAPKPVEASDDLPF